MKDDAVRTVAPGLPGRPPKNAGAFLARMRPRMAAQFVRSMRRAQRYLNDPSTPIDATWVRLFADVADRVGFERRTSQQVDSRSASFSAAVITETRAEERAAMPISDQEALAFLAARVEALRAAAAETAEVER